MNREMSQEFITEQAPIDREIAALEASDVDPLEKAELLFIAEQEVFGEYDYFLQPGVEKRKPKQGDDFRHFYLPYYGGVGFDGNRDDSVIREGYDSDHFYFQSPERSFVRVEQNGLWVVPRNKNPQLYFSMSSCSAVIGYTPDHIYAAHIGFSRYVELEPALEMFKQNGITPENIYVVASVGKSQSDANERAIKAGFTTQIRPKTIEDYEELGLKDENITAFTERFHRDINSQVSEHQGLGRVLATNTFIYNTTNDYKKVYKNYDYHLQIDENPTSRHVFIIEDESK